MTDSTFQFTPFLIAHCINQRSKRCLYPARATLLIELLLARAQFQLWLTCISNWFYNRLYCWFAVSKVIITLADLGAASVKGVCAFRKQVEITLFEWRRWWDTHVWWLHHHLTVRHFEMDSLGFHLLESHFVFSFRYTNQLGTPTDMLGSFTYDWATYVTENSLANF